MTVTYSLYIGSDMFLLSGYHMQHSVN